MGIARRLTRGLLPASRLGAAVWVFQNRRQLADWGRFGVRAARQLATGERADTVAEARLRASLTANRRTRQAAPQIDVRVRDGVAVLSGRVSREVADATRDLAEDTPGVRRIRDEMQVRR